MSDNVQPASPKAPLGRLAAHPDHPDNRHHDGRHGHRDGARQEASRDDSSPGNDQVSIMGIPPRELTPGVNRAITALMDEVTRLRGELAQTQHRESYLEELADQDGVLPLRNRRAFLRELTRLLARAESSGLSPGSLVYMDIVNAEDIKHTHGYRALEAALIHAALILNHELRRSDIAGNLAGTGLGIILTATEEADALDKAEGLVRALEDRPYFWVGDFIHLEVACGVHPLEPGHSAEDVIDAADRDLRGRGAEPPDSW